MDEDTTYPIEIVIFCDNCGREHAEDYLVNEEDDSETRYGYARTYLEAHGWVHRNGLDFCPDCKEFFS